MVKTGEVTALYYTDLVSPDGEILVSPDVPEVQPFTHYYKKCLVKCRQESKYEALKAANMSSTNMTRLIMLPPNTPPETITTLRQAMVSLSKDADFLGDAQKTMRFHPRFEVGEQASGYFKGHRRPAGNRHFLRQYIEQVNK